MRATLATISFSRRFTLWWLLFGAASVAEMAALCWSARTPALATLAYSTGLTLGCMLTIACIYGISARLGEWLARIATSIIWFLLLTLIVTTLQFYA